jgi:hypothetical protein
LVKSTAVQNIRFVSIAIDHAATMTRQADTIELFAANTNPMWERKAAWG